MIEVTVGCGQRWKEDDPMCRKEQLGVVGWKVRELKEG